jgi:cytochrome c553
MRATHFRQFSCRIGLAASLLVLSACGGGGSSSDGNGGPTPSPILVGACQPLPAASTDGFDAKLQDFMDNFCYRSWDHDAAVRSSDGVHPWVKVYYSPGMRQWQDAGARDADIADGAMLVKEQYRTQTAALTEWTVMVKDKTGSFDGWYWADLVPRGNPQTPPGSGVGFATCPEPELPASGFGMYCVNCHASAAAGQLTFATTRFLGNPGAGLDLGPNASDGLHSRLAHRIGAVVETPAGCMIAESFDHVVASGKPNGPLGFVTSDQCAGCHDATGTLSPTRAYLPSMLWPDALAPSMVDLSPNGEWRNSMMGLAGRDPIFFSQLNSETSLHTNLEGQADSKAFIEDTCLRCHGVMGQREFHQDNPGQLFTRAHLDDPTSKYGALARDGVSCAVCHRIAAKDLATPATFTGLFNLDPPNQINGPYNDPLTVPMVNALGMKPQSTPENQIQSSKLCGTCHQILLPVFRADGKRQLDEKGQPKTITEQSTYFEWLNSDFADSGLTPKSCQDCHMRRDYVDENGVDRALYFKIANIEDSSFPLVDFRAPDIDITLRPRLDYARHLLLGINVFGLEIFKQFRTDLGLYKDNPMLRNPERTANGLDHAIGEAVKIATTRTATVHVDSSSKGNTNVTATVTVTNLAGHGFPSGVSFRRAFLHLEVLDANGNTLWQSGNTDANGVIVDGGNTPLVTEFFTPTQQQFQPHFWTDNPITRDDQVQIYEELSVNPESQLTTSFIALDKKVKDNRLQPKGHSLTGPNADELAPVGVCTGTTGCDPGYADGRASNTVKYDIGLTRSVAAAATSIRATLYYQAIPPYYLQQRATDATGTDTDRLQFYRQNLKVAGTKIENWKLKIASDTEKIPTP